MIFKLSALSNVSNRCSFLQIRDVHEGNSFFVEFTPILEIAIPAAFGLAPLSSPESAGLHIAPNFLKSVIPWHMPSFVFYFQRKNPWLERFNWYLAIADQGGLRDEWVRIARYRT